jgi:GH24 family phage-related lysozyme (muramidase)
MDEQLLREILEEFMVKLAALLGEYTPEGAVTLEPELPLEPRIDKDILAELASHEGIVLEAYKDSAGVLTWGIGVTNSSGHRVERYKDNPQTLSKVLEIYEWLVRTKYLPAVEKAFTRPLTKEQLAAALSFHYNTGGIGKASWVKSFNNGDDAKAEQEIMNWRTPPEIIERRAKERDLFFHGKWSNDGTATLYTKVRKPSYVPVWSSATKINIKKELEKWAY